MGSGMTGFLGGFMQTQLALQERNDKRQREAQEAEMKKQDLDLRRKILQGQEASRELQDQQHQLSIYKMLQDIRQQQEEAQEKRAGQEAVQQAASGTAASPPPSPASGLPPAPGGLGLETQVLPNQDPSQPALLAPASARPVVPLSQRGTAGLFNTMADNIAATAGIKPEVLHLYKTSVMPQETRNYDSDAVSPAGAVGISQLMPGTARQEGVQEPRNPLENMRGGLTYLQKMYDAQGGDIAKTLAAYNAGPQRVKQYGGVPPYPETQAYVQRGTAAYEGSPLMRQPSSPELDRLNTEIGAVTEQERRLQALVDQGRPAVRTNPVIEKRLKELREEKKTLLTQRHTLTSESLAAHTEARTARHQALEEERQREPQFDKDFAEHFAIHHNGQRPQEAVKAPGGADVVKQAREAYDAREAKRKVEEDLLKEQARQPYALARAEAGKALTPITKEVAQSLTLNKSIYGSIAKMETILQEGTDLPADFVNLVARDAAEVQPILKRDPKQLTGILQQLITKWGAAKSKDPRVNRFISALGNMRDLVLRERSGASVTGNELERATGAFVGSMPDLGQAFPLFANNLANLKETVMDTLVTMGSTVRPLSGGRVLFESLPTEVKTQILMYERQAAEREQAVQPPTLKPGERALAGDIQEVKP